MDRARQRSRGRQLRSAAAIVIVGAAVVGPIASSPGATRTAASNRAAAESDAHSLLGKLLLPSGARQSATEPSGDAGVLAQPGSYPATPNLIDDVRWWVVDGAPEDAVAYIDAHTPSGSKLAGSGSGSGPNRPTTTLRAFAWPPIP